MGFFSQLYCQKVNDYILGVANNFASTVTPYVALSSTLPTATSGSTWNITEPNTGTNYGGYARQVFASPPSASGGATSNGALITFPTPSSFGGFDAKYYAIMDASSGGNMICAGTLTQEMICNIGVPLTAAIGAVTMTLTQVISGMTTAGANLLLDVLSGKVASATNFPAAIYLRLYTALPTISQIASLNEAAYTSYTGVTTAGLIGAATAATPAVSSTSGAINSPAATGGSSTIVGWGLAPAASGGGALYVAGAISSQVIGTGNQPVVQSGVALLSTQ